MPLGFTLDALPNMMSLLDSRPEGFDSVEEAVKYQYASKVPHRYPSDTLYPA